MKSPPPLRGRVRVGGVAVLAFTASLDRRAIASTLERL
jgi:hypothetical protein